MEQTTATPAPAQPTESTSAPATPAAETADYASYARDADRADLDATATPPVATPKAKETDSDDSPAVDAKGQPVLENGKPISRRQQLANDRVRRAVEEGLAVERQRSQALERELADLRARGHQPAQPKPATEDTRPAWERENRKPALDDFAAESDPYLAYTEALTDYKVESRLRADRAEQQRQSAAQHEAQTVDQKFTTYQQAENAFKAEKPDFDAKTLHIRRDINPMTPLGSALLDSPVAAALIYHFADHPEDYDRIGRLGMNPATLPAALRALGKLEAQFDPPTAAASAPAPAIPIKRTVSSAPPPPPALGTRSAEPADEKRAAVARGDFASYARAADQAEVAALRGR